MSGLTQYPNLIQHPYLGELVFNAEMTWYSGTIEIDEADIDFNIGVRFEDAARYTDVKLLNAKLDSHFAVITQLFIDKFYHHAYQHMVLVLQPIKNDAWLETEELPISLEAFAECITLKGILIYEEGSAELSYAAEDLFWGHDIVVYTDSNGQFEEAHLAE